MPIPAGTRHHRAKLDPEKVAAIRASDLPTVAIARDLGVSPSTVRMVRLNLTWHDPSYTPHVRGTSPAAGRHLPPVPRLPGQLAIED